MQQITAYSITLSACASSADGTSGPGVLAGCALGPAHRNDDVRVQFSFNVTCRNSFTACVAAAVAAAL